MYILSPKSQPEDADRVHIAIPQTPLHPAKVQTDKHLEGIKAGGGGGLPKHQWKGLLECMKKSVEIGWSECGGECVIGGRGAQERREVRSGRGTQRLEEWQGGVGGSPLEARGAGAPEAWSRAGRRRPAPSSLAAQQRAAQDTPPKWPGPGALPGHCQGCARQSRLPAPPEDALGAPPEKTTESENPRRSDFQKSFEAGVTTDDRKERGSRAALPQVVLSPGTEEAACSGRGRTATDPSPGTAEPPPLQDRSEKGGGSWAGRKTPGSFPGLRQKSSTLKLERGGRKGPQVDNQRPVALILLLLLLEEFAAGR